MKAVTAGMSRPADKADTARAETGKARRSRRGSVALTLWALLGIAIFMALGIWQLNAGSGSWR